MLTVPFLELSLQVAHVGKLLGDRSEPIICGNIAQLTRSVGHTGPKHVDWGRRLIRRGRLRFVAQASVTEARDRSLSLSTKEAVVRCQPFVLTQPFVKLIEVDPLMLDNAVGLGNLRFGPLPVVYEVVVGHDQLMVDAKLV